MSGCRFFVDMVEQKLKTEDLTENSVLIGTSSRIADTLKKVEYVSCGSKA